MEAQRALLDSLMGRNRDGDRPEEDVADFQHPRVCKAWLCGLCPHELFQNTRLDLGVCELLHLPALREAYERSSRDFGFEEDLSRQLRGFVDDVEKKIARAQRRLEEHDSNAGERGPGAPERASLSLSLLDVANSQEVLHLAAQIQQIEYQADEARAQGKVDQAVRLLRKAEKLKQQKSRLHALALLKDVRAEKGKQLSDDGKTQEKNGVEEVEMPRETKESEGMSEKETEGDIVKKPREKCADKSNDGASKKLVDVLPGNPLAATNVNQKLRVCDVCGAFLSIFDSDRRLVDHFSGKLHLGYLQIRRKIAEIAERRRERRQSSGSGSGSLSGLEVLDNPATERKSSKEGEVTPAKNPQGRVSRSRSLSRIRRADDPRSEHHTSRGRDRYRKRDRGPSRERSQDRGLNSDRKHVRHKGRSRSRDRDRRGGHGSRHRDQHNSRQGHRQHRRRDSRSRSRSQSRGHRHRHRH